MSSWKSVLVDSLPYYVYKTVIISFLVSSFQEMYELLAILDFNNERKRMSVSMITYHHVEGAINLPFHVEWIRDYLTSRALSLAPCPSAESW